MPWPLLLSVNMTFDLLIKKKLLCYPFKSYIKILEKYFQRSRASLSHCLMWMTVWITSVWFFFAQEKEKQSWPENKTHLGFVWHQSLAQHILELWCLSLSTVLQVLWKRCFCRSEHLDINQSFVAIPWICIMRFLSCQSLLFWQL